MKKAIDIFGEWAEQGKDVGMENTHATPVNEMIDFALEERANLGKNFSFLDLGCGNGWVVRDVAKNKLCDRAVGIDGAEQMIANAESRGGNTKYILADINSFESDDKYDVIHSMEVLYYLNDPSEIIKKISDSLIFIRDIDSTLIPFKSSINNNLDEVTLDFDVKPQDDYSI